MELPINLNQLNPREKIILGVGAAALVVFILVQFIIFPIVDRQEVLQRSVAGKLTAVQEMRSLSTEAEALKQQQNRSTQRMGRRPRGFTLFSFLDGLAGKTQLKGNIDYMKPSTTEPKGSPYKVSVVEMKLVGINMEQLVSYLYRIETSANMVEIKRLAITKTDRKAGFINAVLQVETPLV
ncbi:MAG: type II secretion system protein GspM [Desulfosarcinaceae bacterium]|nr:type II secretion system protein GspM [Desulfosarcinaceae bacterium]